MKWLRKSAELKREEQRLRLEAAHKARRRPHRWFAWYPVPIDQRPDGKMQYVWLELLWKWLDNHNELCYSLKKPKD